MSLLHIKQFHWNPDAVVDTGIHGGSYYGRTVLIIASSHDNNGDNTASSILLLRYGYNDSNNQHLIWRQDDSGSTNMQYACHVWINQSTGNITLQSAGGSGMAIVLYTGL